MLNEQILASLTGYAEFRCCGPLRISRTGTSDQVYVEPAIAGERDFITEITTGMTLLVGTGSQLFIGADAKVTAVDVDTRMVTMGGTPLDVTISAEYAAFNQQCSLSLPASVKMAYVTYCGGGQGGSGGGTGGGGGGGGASSTFVDLPILMDGSGELEITVGSGCLGGAVGAQSANHGGSSLLVCTSNIGATGSLPTGMGPPAVGYQPTPTGRVSKTLADRPAAGGVVNGGNGGAAAPMYGLSDSVLGGAGGTDLVAPGNGSTGVRRGLFCRTGSSGGGGCGTFSAVPGYGGYDTYTCATSATAGSGLGGTGGCSHLGEGGLSGQPGAGFGSGGGGGDAGSGGGNGAPGIVIVRW